jgi:TPR repeat protein
MSENKIFNALRKEDRRTGKGGKGGGLLRYALIAGIVLLVAFNLLFVDFGVDQAGKNRPGKPESALRPFSGVNEGKPEDGNQARALIEASRSRGDTSAPDTLFTQARTFASQGKLADAYLLYFYLAKQGHGPSCLALAEMADPASFDPKTSFFDAPDLSQAYKWYNQALTLGVKKVEPQLRDLKLRVKAAAAGGDEKARRLLAIW